MHFLVIGGSGRTGQLIVTEALAKGHSVTALARSAAKFPIAAQDNLTIVEGTPMKEADIVRAFDRSTDAVLVALNARRTSDSPFAAPRGGGESPARLVADGVANAIAAMRSSASSSGKTERRPRIVILNSLGVGSSFKNMNCLLQATLAWSPMRHGLADHGAADEETRKAEGVDFVLVRSCILAEGDAAPVKVYGDDGAGLPFVPKITRASVARFMVEACEGNEYLGRSPVIANN
ncbi:NAD(P)-binding protein [Xylariomycetidae sp. FL0641]|nr:NAD(P)-binding protein [Xylariomycetidae sp. FL0641]